MKQNNGANGRKFFDIDDRLLALAEQTEQDIKPAKERTENIAFINQQKVLAAFIHNGVGESCFTSSTGYGYGDVGRDKLERVFAEAMECEDALLRHNFMCGTHALTVALFGVLRPGDTMLCVTGMPYDTIQTVIGISKQPASGSLKDFGIGFKKVDLLPDGSVDIEGAVNALRSDSSVKMVYIQRSRGYSLRPSLTVERIEEICGEVRKVRPEVYIIFLIRNRFYGTHREGHFLKKRMVSFFLLTALLTILLQSGVVGITVHAESLGLSQQSGTISTAKAIDLAQIQKVSKLAASQTSSEFAGRLNDALFKATYRPTDIGGSDWVKDYTKRHDMDGDR